MINNPDDSPDVISATVTLSGPDWRIQTTISVPQGPTHLRQLLPVAQSLTDAVVEAAVQVAEAQGQKISCKKGCGACCRQLVPLSETEARYIREVVNHLPEPRRTAIHARFAAARRRLEDAGLLDKLLQPDHYRWTEDDSQSFGLEYFRLSIPCPFLEEEACSIYAERPMACREYLVTSPAENCAHPAAETVRCVKLPFKVWPAVARFDKAPASSRFLRWAPLILAPEWAEAHPEELSPRPGPELLQELFEHLSKTSSPMTQLGEIPPDAPASSSAADSEAVTKI